MIALKRYVCWNQDSVLAVTPRDAAVLNPGHFQAVHHPLQLQERRINAWQGGRRVEETAVIEVLTGSLRPDGYLFVPVVGGSGTGKSHLVRWVYEQLRGRPGWEVRYLAKNRTSIRRVIEIVCEGLEGAAISTAREALASAPAHSEAEEVLAERLLDELALITAKPPTESTLDDRSLQMQRKLQKELPDVLRDPVVRRRLTAKGAVIPRLVGLALRGRESGDKLDNNAIYVIEGDIPVSFEEIGNSSAGARQILSQMASIPSLHRAAVELINRCLPAAVKRVFVSDRIDLIEVFRDVRRELQRRGQELVLFIEDLTVLHGVEREFLDAIVEPASASDGRMCQLRLLFAVTGGHFDAIDTLRTRCEDAYWLDTLYGDKGVDKEEAVSFIARYLNAARLDPESFKDEWNEINACSECDLHVQCHETFGVSEEGYGLYPFNRAAIHKLTSALSSTRFDPRELTRRVVHSFLIRSSKELKNKDFPSNELMTYFDQESEPLDVILATKLREQHPLIYDQLTNLLRYWTSNSQDIDENSALFKAFDLPALRGLSTSAAPRRVATSTSRQRSTTPSTTKPAELWRVHHLLKSPQKGIFTELERWQGNQRSLSAKSTRSLRELIHKAVLSTLDFSGVAINNSSDFEEYCFNRDKHVYVENSVTTQTRSSAIIIVDPSPETVAGLQGLLLLRDTTGIERLEGSRYEQLARYRQLAAELLNKWTTSVTTTLESIDHIFPRAEIEGLLLCGLISGTFEKTKDSTEYLAGLFEPISKSGSEYSKVWSGLVEEATDQHSRLRSRLEAYCGESRGRAGGVRGIRSDVLLGIIEEITEDWKLRSSDPAVERLMRKARDAVTQEWSGLISANKIFVEAIDMNHDWNEQTDQILALVDQAHLKGRLRDASIRTELKRLVSSIESVSVSKLRRFSHRLSLELADHERLRCLASPLARDLKLASKFLASAGEVIEQLENDLSELGMAESSTKELQKVTAAIFDALASLNNGLDHVS